jgi:hypothetical protein
MSFSAGYLTQDLPKNWKDADFSPALVAELTALCASAGASFTGEVAAAELGSGTHGDEWPCNTMQRS